MSAPTPTTDAGAGAGPMPNLPATAGAEPRRSGRGAPAGLVTRAAAYTIDAVVVTWLVSATSFVASSLSSLLDNQPADAGPLDTGMPESLQSGVAATAITVAVVATLYFTLAWWLFGRTVGKLALGLRVVDAHGLRPSFGSSLVRALMYYVSAVFMLGFVWIGLSPKRRGWHDLAARTWVVYDWEAHRHTMDDDDPLPPRTNRRAPAS